MTMQKRKRAHRLLAAILSLVMVFSMVSFSRTVSYATEGDGTGSVESAGNVTITVKNSDGTALAGAAVSYSLSNSIDSTKDASGTLTTDENGAVNVLASADFEENVWTISATISMRGYQTNSAAISNTLITSSTQNFDVSLASAEISGVTIEGKTLTYTGGAQEAVSVTGTAEDDVVSYKLGEGEETFESPTVTDAGEYSITVTVKRENYDDLVETVTTTVNPAALAISVSANEDITYNGSAQELVTLDSEIAVGDKVTWVINDVSTTYEINEENIYSVPTATNVGTYTVQLTVNRGSNYNIYTSGVISVTISATDISGLSAALESELVYDGTEKTLLKETSDGQYVSGLADGDEVYYIVGTNEEAVMTSTDWSEDVPVGTDAGTYTVRIKVVRTNYNDTEVELAPSSVTIDKAEQSFAFTSENYKDGESYNLELTGAVPYSSVTYDFSAANPQNFSDETITYSITCEGDSESASIDDKNGTLTVCYPGTIKVTATLFGNENYEESKISCTLKITGAVSEMADYISFDETEVCYILGTSDTISKQKATKKNDKIEGDITYSTSELPKGVSHNNGVLKVTDYDKLAAALQETRENQLTVEVTATKEKTCRYGEDSASYTVTISFADTPSAPYTLSDIDGENDWYVKPVTVTPAEGYSIALTAGGTFEETIAFSDQGTDTRYVYLKNETGGITDRIEVNIKIDTAAPSGLEIEYSEAVQKKDSTGFSTGFYNPTITITFKAADATSGVVRFDWEYTRASNASTSNLETDSGSLTDIIYDGTTATATLTLPAAEAEQYRGCISFTAVDEAGNSTTKDVDGYEFVVDTVSPTCSVSYTTPVQTIGTQHYYNSEVTFKFTVTEANFYSEDVAVTVSKDGGTATEVAPDWSDGAEEDVYIGAYTLTGDGDYVVFVTYTDRSGNEMASYTSDVITIDTTAPVVDISYEHDGDTQKTIFTVTEHNFRAGDVVITGSIQNIQGNDVAYTASELTALLQSAVWTQNGDAYTYEVDTYVDGIYDLAMNFTDISGNAATESACQFIIDHSAPTGVQIEIVTSPLETVLSAITFGFYNPSVTVRFTAYDDASGVKSFTWNYTKENGASDVNRATDTVATTVAAVQDTSDKSKFTAEITLPDTTASELRGYLAVYATDVYGNSSNKMTDSGNIIVVDTIAPEITVEYSAADRTIGNKAYYNGDVDVTLTVEEANFYSDDVVVQVAQNGGTASAVTPVWTDTSADMHTGSFTLTGDGHYIVTVAYTDKSGNAATTYSSHEITIDTIEPVISVTYQNNAVVNTLADGENNSRAYYDATQTAVVKIIEHNFNADEVDFSITAKDVAGNALSASSLYNMSTWSVDSSGDVHTITITYPGDANYSFDVAYTDLATNAASDYTEDHFTVDTTAPASLSVSYSTSVLDTVLESLTFGFYNAKMTVTITAEDEISGVYSFLYSYTNAEGVSSVNGQLIDEAIAAAGIIYSNGGKTATTSFEIPKYVLGSDNQFNGTVEFTATDRAGNESGEHSETKRIVVDNIKPNATVTYNTPVNTEGSISYYAGDINVTLTIEEANFYAEDVAVAVTKNGTAYTVTPSWTSGNGDIHIGTFTLTEDGDYFITVNYTDKSSNVMAEYASEQLTIDTDIASASFTINGEAKEEIGGAYKNEAVVAFDFEDQNFDSYTVTLVRTRFDSVEDVTGEFINVQDTEKGGTGSFSIPSVVANDGIYVLTVSMTDKSGHSIESTMKFTINRFGSVYEYSDYLVSLIQDGGQYITVSGNNEYAVTEDLVITEYNADQILEDSLLILITRDGESVDVDYTTSPAAIDAAVDIGSSGWYQYVYTISAANFAEDGVYKITLASAYATDDSDSNDSTSVPDNSIDSSGAQILDSMTFTVDTTPPEIRNIVNLENAIVNAQALDVSYTIVDVGGLRSVEVIVDGETIDASTDFGENMYNYSGAFTIEESSSAQTVRLVVTDLAGNVTDTAAEGFSTNDLYIFNDTITVSTNFFVRWYANTPLFWGSIGGVVVLIAAVWFIIAAVKRRKKKATQEAG